MALFAQLLPVIAAMICRRAYVDGCLGDVVRAGVSFHLTSTNSTWLGMGYILLLK